MGLGVGHQQHASAAADEAEVELVVLIAHQLLVEQPGALERFPPEAAERHRVHPARLGRAHAEIRVADPETMRQADRDGARHRRVGAGKGFQHTAHVVRPALEQRLHENREIGGQVDDVRIHAHDHLAARRLDADVQPARGDLPRVVEQADHGMVPGVLRDDVACAVAAHAVHHEQLHPVGGIVARENGLEATAQVPLLVAARHDHRDEGSGGAGHGVPASAAWGQAWKVAVCRLSRAPSAASGHSPRRRAVAQSRETSAPASCRACTRPVTHRAAQ